MGLFATRDFRQLFSAQIIALFGTGLATVALGLLAYDLAGRKAGAVLGTALTIKMVMYVVIAPLAAAYVDRLPRRMFLAALDAVRATVVCTAVHHRGLAHLRPDRGAPVRFGGLYPDLPGGDP